GRIHLLVRNKLLVQHASSDTFITKAIFPEDLMSGAFLQRSDIGKGQYLLPGSNRVVWIDIDRGKFIGHWNVPNIIGASRCSNGDLLVSTSNDRELFRLDTATGSIKKNYGTYKDQFGRPISGYLRYMNFQADGRIVISSGYDGIYLFDDIAETFVNHRHDPLDESSIAGNNTYKVRADNEGHVFVTSRSWGLGYYNCFWQMANTQKFFRDGDGQRIFDGFVGAVHRDAKGNYWLGTQGGLMRWDPATRNSKFYEYGTIGGEKIAGKEEVRAIYADDRDRLWLGLNRYGVVVLDKHREPIRYYDQGQQDIRKKLPANFILDIKDGPGNCIWVATTGGLCFIDKATLDVVQPGSLSALNAYGHKRVNQIWWKDENELWLATNAGAARYDIVKNALKIYENEQGSSGSSVNSITGDHVGNIYIGSRSGIRVVDASGKMHLFAHQQKLPEEACVNMIRDGTGNIWIAGDNYLSCYLPASDMVRVFDHSNGFNGNGFRFNASYNDPGGQLFFGCNEGVSWFDPKDLLKDALTFAATIISLTAGDTTFYFNGN
ncbi:MAG TPA: hypothetical protein VK907_11035, partial [Phnomibacter sp.]|nr:hypothetical protein [Phnomibacter sp.]